MTKMRFGMVGGGGDAFIGRVHLKAALLDGAAELTAGCFSRDHEKSLAFGREHGVAPERIYPDYEEMAAAEAEAADGIDFVIVAAPNDVHYDCCRAFLSRGIHVVCDKPLTHTSQQAEELAQIAEEQGLLLAVTYTYSAIPAAAFMREMVCSGRLGRLLLVKGEFLSGNLLPPNEELDSGMRWRIDPAKAGPSTCCADIGVHAQHLISYVTGLRMEEVSADMHVIGEGRVLDTDFTARVRYEGGVQGHLWCSNVAAGRNGDLSLELYGTKGSVRWSLEDPGTVIVSGAFEGASGDASGGATEGAPVREHLPEGTGENYYLAFAVIYRAFLSALANRRAGLPFDKNFPDVYDGIESLRFVESCIRSSSAGGLWVRMGGDAEAR